ncbi:MULTISPECIES: hypothetical protein [unclassified Microbulbifer]|uniref:hypothetical protein n=1 Tax=unclassified Microbulbifer TaxID=2619833 RepID=UPI0027E59934|nr:MULTISPECIES: hypothetical protein [unclassified Microbulbifer]
MEKNHALAGDYMRRFRISLRLARRNKALCLGAGAGLTLLYYIVLLSAPMIKFQQWPNYVTTYDWLENVGRIIASTPSWSDRLVIINDEWLFEIGYMNYDFGIGISQWSLFVAPIKVLEIMIFGALLGVLFLIVRSIGEASCSKRNLWAAKATGGVGAGLVALTSISLSWVVCCATPSWVVGLAMMGLGVSTSLWLEPIGWWLHMAGLGLLLSALYVAAGYLPDIDKT